MNQFNQRTQLNQWTVAPAAWPQPIPGQMGYCVWQTLPDGARQQVALCFTQAIADDVALGLRLLAFLRAGGVMLNGPDQPAVALDDWIERAFAPNGHEPAPAPQPLVPPPQSDAMRSSRKALHRRREQSP